MAGADRPIKSSHRAIRTYYEALAGYAGQDVKHETAVRSAFQNLLAEAARKRGWTLVPELPAERAGRARVVPDGTVRDEFLIPRGYWEAKDTDDDLDAEIAKKIARGYPLTNTIFEDTRQGVLYQDGSEVLRVDLTNKAQLADLLNAFLTHSEPDIDEFEKAVEEFKERVPELARGLTERIAQAHEGNSRFIAAFGQFFDVCKASLNPNLSRAAVDEMLVQHLLTERLFRTIFADPDFTRRNVIAAEVEKVIAALVSRSFNRHDFLKSLDRFYVAIEDAARGLDDFTDKQHFLNTVYERFFQGYSVKVADTHGIVYTPQPIVDFMCASVAEVLENEFGKPLGSPGVHILDPCTGTGNFIVNLLRRIPKRDLPRMYREQLFANEVMLLPYYIAALNIEHAYYELTGEYEPFEGLCFVDSLDMAEHAQAEFGFMTEENAARVERQKGAPITVILGNPPYNVGQLNENDNNKNRRYEVVEQRIRGTYAADSTATNKNALSDAYVKFFRWATDRLEGRDGIVCFVSNNSFVDQLAFDGMRAHLLRDFTDVHHVDLHGNVRKNPKLSGTTHNVFGIQVGVGITVAVRRREGERPREPKRNGEPQTGQVFYHRVPEFWRREEKLGMLVEHQRVSAVPWRELTPDAQHTWLVPEGADQFATFISIGSKAAKRAHDDDAKVVFKNYGRGVATCRDDVVYDFDREALEQRVRQFIEDYNAEVDRWQRAGGDANVDDFVHYDKVKWSESLKANLARGTDASFDEAAVRSSLYRPFCQRYVFFDAILNERRYQFPRIFPTPDTEQENRAICHVTAGSTKAFHCVLVGKIPDLHLTGDSQCFPFYVYDEDGSNRGENITDWAFEQFRAHYSDGAVDACTATVPAAVSGASRLRYGRQDAYLTASEDAGATPGDAGATPGDAGATPRDAGATPWDAGATPEDAGATPGDAGATPGDAGATPEDAGATPGDAGATEDAGARAGIVGDIRYGHVTIRDRGRLPHWETEYAVYLITYHLGDSLAAHVLAQLREEREQQRKAVQKERGKVPKAIEKEIAHAMSQRVGEYLDKGAGACYLGDPRVAAMVRDAVMYFDGERYRLHAWCIMPNHVHLILRLLPGWSLEKVAHSLKSFTSKEANKILGRKGTFWQREYYDHIIRNEDEYWHLMEYVLGNPTAAGLEDWPWIGTGAAGRQDAGGTASEDAGATTEARSAAIPSRSAAVPARSAAVPARSAAVPARSAAVPARSAAVPARSAAVPAAVSGASRPRDGRQDTHDTITKWDVFYYVYGLLHHPGYREKYGDCLKRELPRIPFAPDFRAFANAGRDLAKWHLDYENVDPYRLEFEVAPDKSLSYRVEDKMRLSKDKSALTVNPSLTLVGIPAETFEYRLGNRSALEWVIDQYRVKTDKRSGITSDPNRPDDPEYIVRLVGQVIRVSLETVDIVNALPADFGG